MSARLEPRMPNCMSIRPSFRSMTACVEVLYGM